MFYRAKRVLRRAWFNWGTRGLLRTPAVVADDAGLTLVSMLCHGEVRMYLLAVKSFCRQMGRNPQVVILGDGSLTEEDRGLIEAHLPGARILGFADVMPAACPKGNCWERLLLITDLLERTYVVQLDSDTLTKGPIDEVKACIAANRSFTLLGDRSFPEIEPMLSACQRSKANENAMVQAVVERNFDQLPEAAGLKYVRGNAGFVGFAKGSVSREKVEWFSEMMERLAKEKWDEWGSEQVASNLVIANSEGAVPLPFPKYCSYWAHEDVDYTQSSFVHFIGPFRFANGMYLRSAKRVLATLR